MLRFVNYIINLYDDDDDDDDDDDNEKQWQIGTVARWANYCRDEVFEHESSRIRKQIMC